MKKSIVCIVLVVAASLILLAAGVRGAFQCASGVATEVCFIVQDSSGNTIFSVTPTAVTSYVPFATAGAWSQDMTMGTPLPAPLAGHCILGSNGTTPTPKVGWQCFGDATPSNLNDIVYLTHTNVWTAQNTFNFDTELLGGATVRNNFTFQDQAGDLDLNRQAVIESGLTTNTDASGELAFAAAATASYTFVHHTGRAVHMECLVAPQFNPAANTYWVTYTATTSFTINFSGAVTGAVSYHCYGRA